MATFLKTHVNFQEEQQITAEIQETTQIHHLSSRHPPWYSPETGIYKSKHPSIELPSEPFLDVVSFILSQKHNGITAFIDSSSGFSVSYSQFFSLVKSMASGLHQLGVKQGDVIFILLPNSIYFPVIFLGALSLGAIVTPMNPLSSLLEIKKQVVDLNPRFAFSVPNKVDELRIALGGCSIVGVPDYVNFDRIPSESDYLHKIIFSDPLMAPRPKIKQHDTAAILYSSGTTGSVKGVVLTHRNFMAMMEHFVRFESSQYDYPSTSNIYLATVPMFHIYGLSQFVMGLLSLGTTVVVMKKFDADEMVRAIDGYGVTHFPTVPPLLMTLIRKVKSSPGNSFGSLKQVSCGAASLSSKLIEDFIHTLPHVDLIQGYGLTESTAVGTRGYNTFKVRKYSSAGLLAPNARAKVVDWVSGSCLPPGSVGELWLHTPGVMKEYLNNVAATMATIDEDGWLHTGDIVCFDQEGYLYVLDRLKEFIKYKGFQIAPADLESVLLSHPEVLDAAVTAAKDEEAGEIPIAFVVRKDGSSLSDTALMDYVAKQVIILRSLLRAFLAKLNV
ncbi:4-coumarate-- ligase-like 6 [Olea europaea subsp. europaea]|uniref:4-coumarate--CoA ligase n=1 Tax=Olea europaea subsp. europaea TaxID=158383 RepID=A0A8S0QSC7_OLEEU|nr:4-coumarate-- ligase-like 6 [Olea europaea subsp. europaea]